MAKAEEAVWESGLRRSNFRENVEAILVAVLLALFIRTFVVQAFKIPSGSMMQTLKIGDHILVNKFSYGLDIPFFNIALFSGREIERGDIVVFKYPEDPDKDFIKRVIGLEGDIVLIKNKRVYVNQALLKEPYTIFTDSRRIPVRDDLGPIEVPPGKLFMLGDNRDNSHDSRFWGFVDKKAVLGNAFMIYWSWDGESDALANHVRWRRIGSFIR